MNLSLNTSTHLSHSPQDLEVPWGPTLSRRATPMTPGCPSRLFFRSFRFSPRVGRTIMRKPSARGRKQPQMRNLMQKRGHESKVFNLQMNSNHFKEAFIARRFDRLSWRRICCLSSWLQALMLYLVNWLFEEVHTRNMVRNSISVKLINVALIMPLQWWALQCKCCLKGRSALGM